MRATAGLVLAAWAACWGHAACNLDLDEGLLERDGGLDASSGGSGGVDGADSAAGAAGANGCSSDADCPTDGCLEGRCVNGSCVVTVCPSANACEARSCDTAARVCSPPITLGFHAGVVPVEQGIGCNGSAPLCVATMGDYVLIGTADGGLVAFRMTNPLSPEVVNVQAPPFAITRLVASRNRTLMIGPVAAGKLSVAWIDLPSDPRAETLASQAVAVTFANAFQAAYGAEPGAFLLVKNEPAEFFPAAHVTPPLAANASVTLLPSSGIPAEEWIVGASGTRLVGFRIDVSAGVYAPAFSLETNAGTSAAQNLGEQALFAETGEVSPALGANFFTSASDGSLLWTTNRVTRPDAGLEISNTVAFFWPLAGSDATFSGARQVVLESYGDHGPNAPLSGPSALVGSATALVTAADPANTVQTSVQSVTREADTLTRGVGRHVLPLTTNAIGIAGGPRFGYVLTPSTSAPPNPPDAALHVFAPACSP